MVTWSSCRPAEGRDSEVDVDHHSRFSVEVLFYRARWLAVRSGRYLFLLAALSFLFFFSGYIGRPASSPSFAEIRERLHRAIGKDFRVWVSEGSGSGQSLEEAASAKEAIADEQRSRLLAAIDGELSQKVTGRTGAELAEERSGEAGWMGAYWDWLWQWSEWRGKVFGLALRTVLLSLVCLGLSAGGIVAAVLYGGYDPAVEGADNGMLRQRRGARWMLYGLGAFPAYALVYLLDDWLKFLQLGNGPLLVAALLALAAGDGVLVNNLEDFREAWKRLGQRDFMLGVRERLGAEKARRYLARIALIDLLPHAVVRLSVIVGSLVVVAIAPGIYRGWSLGGPLDIDEASAVWLGYSLDALWGLSVVMVGLTFAVDWLRGRWQKDRKGIDRLDQLADARPRDEFELRKALLALGALVGCFLLIVAIHWKHDAVDVWWRFAHSLGAALVGGSVGLLLAVTVGMLVPLYLEAGAVIIQFFEAIPRVIGVAFLMTVANLQMPDLSGWERWLVWSMLLGIFSFAEIARGLYSRVTYLKNVDFVSGLRALGLRRWQIFRLHVWPQMQGRVFASIYPLVRAIVFCEGAIAILRFAMRGLAIDLLPVGSLLAEGAREMGLDTLRGLLFGLAVVATMAACIEAGSRILRLAWKWAFRNPA